MTCKIGNLGWWFGMFVTFLRLLLSGLFITNITNISTGSDNPLNVPANVEPGVRIVQFFADLISVFVQDDLRTALELCLHPCYPGFQVASHQADVQEKAFVLRITL